MRLGHALAQVVEPADGSGRGIVPIRLALADAVEVLQMEECEVGQLPVGLRQVGLGLPENGRARRPTTPATGRPPDPQSGRSM